VAATRGSRREKGGTDALNGYKSTTWMTIGLTRPKKGGGKSGQKRAAKRRRSSETTQTTCT
jgi:hypothetical protein